MVRGDGARMGYVTPIFVVEPPFARKLRLAKEHHERINQQQTEATRLFDEKEKVRKVRRRERLLEIKADRNDVLTIYLEDGQIWRQIDTTYITGSRIRKAETVTIKKAAFGSFLMKLDDSNTTFRVRRLN